LGNDIAQRRALAAQALERMTQNAEELGLYDEPQWCQQRTLLVPQALHDEGKTTPCWCHTGRHGAGSR
jgi:hypothetical protein